MKDKPCSAEVLGENLVGLTQLPGVALSKGRSSLVLRTMRKTK